MTMTRTLYAHRLSQPSRAVEILLRELQVPYTWHEIDFANGQAREAWFAGRINAFKTIPALVETADKEVDAAEAFRLGESHAILRYLCRQAGDQEKARRWYPGDQDSRRTARVDQWLAWYHNGIRRFDSFHSIMNLHLTLPMLKYELQKTQIRPLQEGLKPGLALLEAQLERQPAGQGGSVSPRFLCGGEHPTLADLVMACELYQIVAIGYRFQGYPGVAQWIDTIADRPHFQDVSADILEQGRSIREQNGSYLDLDNTFI